MKDYTDIIIAPIITEKSSANAEKNVYTFKVNNKASKIEIKKAVEEAFDVHVTKVNTLNTKPKSKRVGRYTGQTKTYKKAYVTIADGEKIELI